MGQKINPHLFRLGVTSGWSSRWFDTRNFAKWLLEDYRIRELINRRFKRAATTIDIERFGSELKVTIMTSKPGVIIGKGGGGVEELKVDLKALSSVPTVTVDVKEIKSPDASAAVIANNIAEQIERRIPFRRAIKQAIEAGKQARVEGMRIVIAGRLNGAEIARREVLSFGKVPLHTIKSRIDYAFRTAFTTYGTIGVKVWVKPNAADEVEVDTEQK